MASEFQSFYLPRGISLNFAKVKDRDRYLCPSLKRAWSGARDIM